MSVGPDAARLLLASEGVPVPRPFHLRWLLPAVCGQHIRRWWVVWGISWPLAAVAMLTWRLGAGDSWQVSAASTALLLALPGVLGPSVTIPVGVDLPSMAWSLVGVSLFVNVHPVAGIVAVGVAAAIKEQAPLWSALWLWSPWLLLAGVVPLVRALVAKSGPDPLGPQFQRIVDHPFRTALEHHQGRWRDGWLWVAPWGVCLAGLVGADWRLCVLLVVAHLQVLVATDTVRLVHCAAGPALAVAAAQVIPAEWLLLAVVVHVVWFRIPERV